VAAADAGEPAPVTAASLFRWTARSRSLPTGHAAPALIVLKALIVLPAVFVLPAIATPSEQAVEPPAMAGTSGLLDLTVPRERAAPGRSACTSVVHRACAAMPLASPAAANAMASLAATQTADQVLERVVIEGERLRRPPTVREVIEAATARQTWREMESGEGGRCACATPCPPWPQACCVCTKGGRDARIHNLVRH
jgi:hypothetical protein